MAQALHQQIIQLWFNNLEIWRLNGMERFSHEKAYLIYLPNPDDPEIHFLKCFNELKHTGDKPEERKVTDLFGDIKSKLEESQYIVYRNYLITSNVKPSQEYQILIFSLENKIHPGKGDIASIIDLSSETKYHYFLNQDGSGAGIINHLHYQALITPLPASKFHAQEFESEDGVTLSRIDKPFFGIRISGDSSEKIESLILNIAEVNPKRKTFQVIRELGLPFNILIFDGNVIIVPRTKEIPDNPKWHPYPGENSNENWKFAGAEIGGVFFPRTKRQFDQLVTIGQMHEALADVTIREEKQKKILMEVIRNRLG